MRLRSTLATGIKIEGVMQRLQRQAITLDGIGLNEESLLVTESETWDIIMWLDDQYMKTVGTHANHDTVSQVRKKILAGIISVFGHKLEVV